MYLAEYAAAILDDETKVWDTEMHLRDYSSVPKGSCMEGFKCTQRSQKMHPRIVQSCCHIFLRIIRYDGSCIYKIDDNLSRQQKCLCGETHSCFLSS